MTPPPPGMSLQLQNLLVWHMLGQPIGNRRVRFSRIDGVERWWIEEIKPR